MADRKEILKDIRDTIGNAPCKADLMRYLGLSKDGLKPFLEGLPFYHLTDRKVYYLAIDIAKRIDEREAGCAPARQNVKKQRKAPCAAVQSVTQEA